MSILQEELTRLEAELLVIINILVENDLTTVNKFQNKTEKMIDYLHHLREQVTSKEKVKDELGRKDELLESNKRNNKEESI